MKPFQINVKIPLPRPLFKINIALSFLTFPPKFHKHENCQYRFYTGIYDKIDLCHPAKVYAAWLLLKDYIHFFINN